MYFQPLQSLNSDRLGHIHSGMDVDAFQILYISLEDVKFVTLIIAPG
jgi:hypothetical protein